jgi:SGNH hydrolase-like domain, acetyltransferase AlgX
MAARISEMVRTSAPASRLDRVVAAAFLVALIVPGAALISGARPPELENAKPASLPPLSAGALTDTSTYTAIDRFIADNLPGRDVAVRGYGGLDYELLGGSASGQVVVGAGDWLFYVGELRPSCRTTAAGLLTQIDTVAGQAAGVGIDFRFVVAPDKHAIFPDRRRSDDPIPPACTDDQRDALRAGMATRPGSTIDLWAPVMAAKARGMDGLYFSQDSHWTPTGALPAVQALVDSLAPGVWGDSEISIDGTSTYPMELARLMGIPRDGVVPNDVKLTNAPEISAYTVSGDGELVQGTTLVVYDSFFNINRPRIVPWFAHTVWVHGSDLRDHPGLVADLPPIDRIVVERVERDAYDLDLVSLLTPVIDRARSEP